MNKMVIALPLAALLVACGSKSSGGGGSTSDLHIVGSSTVYPFTKAVAEDFMRANAGINVTVESTGTGAGMKLFCAGVGGQSPDIEDASRAMKTGMQLTKAHPASRICSTYHLVAISLPTGR